VRRRRLPGDRHLGRATADGAHGDGSGQPGRDLDHLDHVYHDHDGRLDRSRRSLLLVGGGLVGVGRELGLDDAGVLRNERRDVGRDVGRDLRRHDWIGHWRPDRRKRGRGSERRDVELGWQLVGLGLRQRRGRPSVAIRLGAATAALAHLYFAVPGVVVVVVVVGVGTGFVTSVALYSTRVPG